jgi:hypothetical protein
VAKFGDQGCGGGNGDDVAASPADDGSDYLDAGDPRQEKLVACRRVGQAADPAAAGFLQITLDYGAGVEDESGHVSVAR